MKTKSNKPSPAHEANIKRFSSRPGRIIVVKGVKWKWKFGTTICAYSELGGKCTEQYWRISIQDPFSYDRCPCTPKQIENWLFDKDPTAL